MFDWKKWILRPMIFGMGFAMASILIIGVWSYLHSLPSKPKPWDNRTIKASFSELSLNQGDNIKVFIKYSVENCSKLDYYLPNDPKCVFMVLPKDQGLSHDEEISWNPGTYIPPGQKILITFEINYSFNSSYPKSEVGDMDKMAKFMGNKLKDFIGFRILDTVNRYQIDFPKGWDLPDEKQTKK